MPTQTEIRQVITNQIIEALQSGGLPPWRRPWLNHENAGLPTNVVSKNTSDESSAAGRAPTVLALLVLRNQLLNGVDLLGAVIGISLGTIASLLWWFAARGHLPAGRSIGLHAVVGGLILGGIGLAVGFLGTIIFMPEANQGPLLGTFITGPIGFVEGVVLGLPLSELHPCPAV